MTDSDSARRIGVEIEFSGLTVAEAAEAVRHALGGAVAWQTPHVATLSGTPLGALTFELDTRYAKKAKDPSVLDELLEQTGLREGAADLLSGLSVVPVELVTEPIRRADFDVLDRAIAALREAGAEGTRGAALYAFGMHLNPEHKGDDAEAVAIAAAYAFAERWLRHRRPPDTARRATPFVDPYRPAYVRDLAAACADGVPDLEAFTRLYGEHCPTRNHGLDMWPLLGHLAPDLARRHHDGPVKGARPTFHYRLPDSRVGDPDWSPLAELDLWERIETAARDPEAFEALRSAAAARADGDLAHDAHVEAVAGVLA